MARRRATCCRGWCASSRPTRSPAPRATTTSCPRSTASRSAGRGTAKRWQRTHVNTACKLLLFEHAFDTLGCKVVGLADRQLQLRVAAGDRSAGSEARRRAAPSSGAARRHRARFVHVQRSAGAEWPDVRRHLRLRLERHRAGNRHRLARPSEGDRLAEPPSRRAHEDEVPPAWPRRARAPCRGVRTVTWPRTATRQLARAALAPDRPGSRRSRPRALRRAEPAERVLRRLRQRRRLALHRLRLDVGADLRRPADRLDRRDRGRAVGPEHHLRRLGRRHHPARSRDGRRRVQVHRRAARRGRTSGSATRR